MISPNLRPNLDRRSQSGPLYGSQMQKSAPHLPTYRRHVSALVITRAVRRGYTVFLTTSIEPARFGRAGGPNFGFHGRQGPGGHVHRVLRPIPGHKTPCPLRLHSRHCAEELSTFSHFHAAICINHLLPHDVFLRDNGQFGHRLAAKEALEVADAAIAQARFDGSTSLFYNCKNTHTQETYIGDLKTYISLWSTNH